MPQSMRSQGSPAAGAVLRSQAGRPDVDGTGSFAAQASPVQVPSAPSQAGAQDPFGPVEQTPFGLQSVSQASASAAATPPGDASQSTWPSPFNAWPWATAPSEPEPVMTMVSVKSTPASRKKKMRQDAAKTQLQDALRNSVNDPHALSVALHEAKSNHVEEIAPELIQQAEAAVQEAHNVSLRADAERELQSVMQTLSGNLKSKELDMATLSRNTQLLETALKDAKELGLQTPQADDLLLQAHAEEEKRRGKAAEESPVRPDASPTARIEEPASPAAAPPPAPTLPPVMQQAATPVNAEMIQMKDKVSRLLQTLIAGGSSAEPLRKAAEVAAAAGLEDESLQARSVAEERQLAHEEAARALNSGDLNLIQKAMKQVNSAGGPAKDRQHLAHVLEMGDDRSSVTSVLPRGQPLTPAAWEAFREREEQLLQHLKEDRENQLDEFRTEAEKIHAALQAAQTAQARIVREPARSLPGTEADSRSGFREAAENAPFSAPDRLQEAQSGFQPGWTNPFGLDPAKEVFDPFGVPAYDYRTLLTNAQLRTQMHGKPFEHPDFWNVRGSKASNVMHF